MPEKRAADPRELRRAMRVIQDTLDSFGIDAEAGEVTRGPRVTLFEVNPARGVRVESVSAIGNNLAMELSAVSLRILAPVPGEDYIGLEVPNREGDIVSCRELMTSDLWRETRARLPLIVGKNIRGSDVVLDLTRAPHLLVAGATGSGKSVCLNAMLMSLLFRFTPDELQLILIDPKVVEFSIYNRLPHLIVPVITDTPDVVMALSWLVREMERRYRLMAKVGARNLDGFNQRPTDPPGTKDDDGNAIPERLPFIVLVIDELADIMLTAREHVERNLTRIAQMSRAVGIHTIIATQRPSVNIITGIIKANYPTRIAFQVSSQIDSRTILDGKGAESLLGRGDMLFKAPDGSRMQRLQGVFVEDLEIEHAVAHVSRQAGQTFDEAVLRPSEDDLPALEAGDELDEAERRLVQAALDIIARDRRASTSYIQRRLRIGYNRAATIIETLQLRGVLGPQIGSAPREILVDESGAFIDV
ncbi:MAG: DNA translocase FtsK [Lentisphaerae bacterium]|nr:DNA translocase FtsK [Lentisphaerota bacterium]MBT5605001.1 DNA translocase FtsK [Lentisphaerota bacterium]MBT7054631.1 DNA translocase FtsK [Lentisphaerota bacterium]MBT7844660.1 DNA translocase FtsK [Lentisphaerota bacterium]